MPNTKMALGGCLGVGRCGHMSEIVQALSGSVREFFYSRRARTAITLSWYGQQNEQRRQWNHHHYQENHHQHNWHFYFTAYDATAISKQPLTEVTFNVPVRRG